MTNGTSFPGATSLPRLIFARKSNLRLTIYFYDDGTAEKFLALKAAAPLLVGMRNRRTQAEVATGLCPGVTTADRQRIIELEKGNREPRRTKPIRRCGSWRTAEHVELATAEWIG